METALEQFRKGGLVLVMDDEGRENEGDLICAASCVTASTVAFMVKHTTGILCVPMTKTRAQRLQLPLMVESNEDPNGLGGNT